MVILVETHSQNPSSTASFSYLCSRFASFVFIPGTGYIGGIWFFGDPSFLFFLIHIS